MRLDLAEQLLARVLDWSEETVEKEHKVLRLLSELKYDEYQQFFSGRRFIESLALWLNQFEMPDRQVAYNFVKERLIFISNDEMLHIIASVYPHWIKKELQANAAEIDELPWFKVGAVKAGDTYTRLKQRALFLGLSDGARTDQLRRKNPNDINNEQLWHTYELSKPKAEDLKKELVKKTGDDQSYFSSVWLLDDFSGSGLSYIRYDEDEKKYKGKIPKVYEQLFQDRDGDLTDPTRCKVYIVLYVATEKARRHIEEESAAFCKEICFSPPKVLVIFLIGDEVSLSKTEHHDNGFLKLATSDEYYDPRAHDKHIKVGGQEDAKLGFAYCALPLILSHNTPNNSIYLLWGPELLTPHGLFPRVSRHREE
mgnify:CR=1 FL=1